MSSFYEWSPVSFKIDERMGKSQAELALKECLCEKGRVTGIRALDVDAHVDKKRIFVDGGRFRIKISDITHIETREPATIIVDTTTEKCPHSRYELTAYANDSRFATFVECLKASYAKLCSESSKQLGSFMQKSETKALGKSRLVTNQKTKKPRPRGTFGSKGGHRKLVASLGDAWLSEDEDNRKENTVVPKRESTSGIASDMDMDFDKDEESDDFLEKRPSKRSQKTRKAFVLEDSESDNDDNVFSSEQTTPSAERLVSPTTETPKDGSTNAEPKNQHEKGQKSITSFFQKPAGKRFDPSIGETAAIGTPSRPRKSSPGTPNRLAKSPASAAMVRSANKTIDSKNHWLLHSPTKTSVEEKRKKELFGSHSPMKTPFKTPDDILASSPTVVRYVKRQNTHQRKRHIHSGFRHSTGSASALSFQSEDHRQKRLRRNDILSEGSEIEAKPNSPFRGLRNLGNTCYMNASLQLIYTALGFVSSIKETSFAGELTRSVTQIARRLEDRSDTLPIDPSCVKSAMDKLSDKFLGYQQRDAHEFLSDLIDNMHEEMQKESSTALSRVATQETPSSTHEEAVGTSAGATQVSDETPATIPAVPCLDTTKGAETEEAKIAAEDEAEQVSMETDAESPACRLPTDDFLLTVEVCLECDTCGYSRSKTETYRHLSIDILSDGEEDSSVSKSLDHFFQPEKRELKCETCGKGDHASQTLRILSM